MNKIIIALTAVAGILIMSCNTEGVKKNFKSEKDKVTVAEASEMLNGNALLVDVREPYELVKQSYEVKKSINIPLDSLYSKLNDIPKDIQVILACQKGGRSQKAFDLLKSKGYINIANMEGGMDAWSNAGLPTKSADSAKESNLVTDDNSDGLKKTAYKKDETGVSQQIKPRSVVATPLNHLEVYCFHGTRQCQTCKNMKANTKATLVKYFSDELKAGKIVFQIIDVDDAANEKLAEKFQATGTALMINKVVNGKDNIIDWSDFAFDKANEEKKFIPELKIKIEEALK